MSTLLNLSNHPSQGWSDAQRQDWDEIIDLPFPAIPPRASGLEVAQLAHQFSLEILYRLGLRPEVEISQQNISRLLHGREVAVHLMGEICFCVELADILRAWHIKVVVSTSERKSVETVDPQTGAVQKTAIFQFVGWREVL
jgi:hypothetical protein